MKLIIGGAWQGKQAYVKEVLGIKEEILDGKTCSMEECCKAACVRNYHLFVKRMLEQGEDPLERTAYLAEKNPKVVVIINEIGAGIIPLEREERIWREWAGRTGCYLAEQSELVVRIQCGLPVIIKDKTK